MSATTSGRAHRFIRARRCFAYPFDVCPDGMPHAVRTIEFGDPEIAQWHLLPGLPGFAMRAHVGTLGPATLTDRSANGLLAELGPQTATSPLVWAIGRTTRRNGEQFSRQSAGKIAHSHQSLARRRVHILGMASNS